VRTAQVVGTDGEVEGFVLKQFGYLPRTRAPGTRWCGEGSPRFSVKSARLPGRAPTVRVLACCVQVGPVAGAEVSVDA
jgi:hypothetical protein